MMLKDKVQSSRVKTQIIKFKAQSSMFKGYKTHCSNHKGQSVLYQIYFTSF